MFSNGRDYFSMQMLSHFKTESHTLKLIPHYYQSNNIRIRAPGRTQPAESIKSCFLTHRIWNLHFEIYLRINTSGFKSSLFFSFSFSLSKEHGSVSAVFKFLNVFILIKKKINPIIQVRKCLHHRSFPEISPKVKDSHTYGLGTCIGKFLGKFVRFQ